jgi:RsiW-degrading membrane proteinase PrsW (M82 family)
LLELLAVASAPSLALFLFFYLRDKYEKEPLWLLFKGFWLGALMVIPAGIIEVFLLDHVLPAPGDLVMLFIQITLGIALVEEGLKFLVLRLYLYPKPAFNEPYDGIMYGVIVALGFAFAENAAYVFSFGLQVGIGRAILAVPMHALVGVFMGYHLAQSQFSDQAWRRRWVVLLSLGIPTLVHGFYNWLLFSELLLGVLGVVPLSVASWFYALRAVRQHQAASPFRV